MRRHQARRSRWWGARTIPAEAWAFIVIIAIVSALTIAYERWA